MDSSGSCVERYQQGMTIDGIEGRQMGQTELSDRYIKDHLGSVMKVIREYGTAENEYIYDSFGNIIYQSGTLTNPRLYTSRFYDSESGIYYYRARYYDSSTGRFLSEDPLRMEKSDKEQFRTNIYGSGFDEIWELYIFLINNRNCNPSLESYRDLNLYIYVKNNPINLADPTGLKSKKCCGTWRSISIRLANAVCLCYWLCYHPSGVIWDGNWFARPSTIGEIIYTGGGGLKRGDSCLCKDPDGGLHIVKLRN